MSQHPRKVPSYRLHKGSEQAFVKLGERYIYLGKHGMGVLEYSTTRRLHLQRTS